MKYFLLLFLFSGLLEAKEIKVEVFLKSDSSLVAADSGDESIVSLQELERKMNASYSDSNIFDVVTTDITAQKEAEAQAEVQRRQDIRQIKQMISTVQSDTTIGDDVKRVLIRLIRELKE